jgi:hypothetical protein
MGVDGRVTPDMLPPGQSGNTGSIQRWQQLPPPDNTPRDGNDLIMKQLAYAGITPEKLQAAASVIDPGNPNNIFAVANRPLVNIPTPGAQFMGQHPYLGGAATSGAKFVSGFTSPLSLGIMAATGGTGSAVRKLMALGFSLLGAKRIVEDSAQLAHVKDPA